MIATRKTGEEHEPPDQMVRRFLSELALNPLSLSKYDAILELLAQLHDEVIEISTKHEHPRDPWGRTPTQNTIAALESHEDAFEEFEIEDVSFDQFDALEDLEEVAAAEEEPLTDAARSARIQGLLREAQAYLDFALYIRVSQVLRDAKELAHECQSTIACATDLSEEQAGRCSDLQKLASLYRLLSIVEGIEDTRVVTLHTDEVSPWAAFAAHRKRLCFGCIVDGEAVIDETLARDVPALHEELVNADGQNLRTMQAIIARTIAPQERDALQGQMARALLSAVEPATREPVRIKQTPVAAPEKPITMAPVDIYLGVIKALGLHDGDNAAWSFYASARDMVDSGYVFFAANALSPIPLAFVQRPTMEEAARIASTAVELVEVRDNLPDRPSAFTFHFGRALWCAVVDQKYVALCRTSTQSLGRIASLAQRAIRRPDA